jgi:hypothetical protein
MRVTGSPRRPILHNGAAGVASFHHLDRHIRDIPVRCKDRTYGETNISRFSHGWMLLKMVWFGLR